jgi:hypothetical protein
MGAFRTGRSSLRSRATDLGDAAGYGPFLGGDKFGLGYGKMEPQSEDSILVHPNRWKLLLGFRDINQHTIGICHLKLSEAALGK